MRKKAMYRGVMIHAYRSKILVEVLPPETHFENKLNLRLIDKKKHYEHDVRYGRVQSVGSLVRGVSVGDVVMFVGAAGFTLDGEAFEKRPEFGEGVRWLTESDCLAVVEPVRDEVAA